MHGTLRTQALDWASVVVLLLVVGLLFLPGTGPMWQRWDAWRQARTLARTLEAEWPQIAGSGATLFPQSGSASPGYGEVSMVVFNDYQCPFCRRLDAQLHRLAHSGILKTSVRIRHWPLGSHPVARMAAVGAICAEEAGEFETMHSFLMSSEGWYSAADAGVLGVEAGIVALGPYQACLASPRPDSILALDAEVVQQLKMSGTPTILTRQQRYTGLPTDDALVSMDSP